MVNVPADYFAELWVSLEEDSGSLSVDPPEGYSDLIAQAKEALGDAGDTEKLRQWVGQDKGLYIFAAIAIDNWYEPLGGCKGNRAVLPQHMHEVFDEYLVSSRLNGSTGKRVILRRPFWGSWADEENLLPLDSVLSKFFISLMVLPDEIASTAANDADLKDSVRLNFRIARSADSREINTREWKIGVAPIAQLPSDIDFEHVPDGQFFSYDAKAMDLTDRVREVVEKLCQAGCHIIAFPEMAIHPASRSALGSIIRKVGANSSLSLVLAGTTRTDNGADKPFNRCTIFNHRGEVILEQNKLTRWNLNTSSCQRFAFSPGEDGFYYEYITEGKEITIVENRDIGRFAALICEDLRRTEPGKWLRSNMLLDLQFTPVMDSDLHKKKWEVDFGGKATLAGGCRVIVVNSMPLTYRQNEANRQGEAGGDVVNDCGVALALDRVSKGIRMHVVRMPLDSPMCQLDHFDWQPQKWTIVDKNQLTVN